MKVRALPPRPPLPCVWRAPLALLTTLFLALAPSACSGEEREAAAIRDLVDKEVRAINTRDLKLLSEVWAQDDRITLFDVPPPGRFQGWTIIGRQWKDFFDRFSELHVEVQALRVDVAGDVAWATYDWALSGSMGDRPVQDQGQATAIYRRGDEGWRVVHAHYSPAPPAATTGTPPAAGGGSPAAEAGSPPAGASAAPTAAAGVAAPRAN